MNEFSIPLMLLLRSLFSLFLKIVGFLQSRRLKYSFVSALAQSFRSSSSSSSSLYLFFLLDDGDGHQQHKTTTLIWDDDFFCERNRRGQKGRKNLRIFKTLNTPVLSVFFSFRFASVFCQLLPFCVYISCRPTYSLSLSLSLSQKRRNAKSGGRVFENVVVFFFLKEEFTLYCAEEAFLWEKKKKFFENWIGGTENIIVFIFIFIIRRRLSDERVERRRQQKRG